MRRTGVHESEGLILPRTGHRAATRRKFAAYPAFGRAACVAAMLASPLLAQVKLSGISAREASILADAESRTYYLYASADSGAVVAYRSKDLASWEGPSPVFHVPAGWASAAQGARDPRTYAYRGKYYLFVTLANPDRVIAKPPDSWRVNTMQGTQVFSAESPLGPFGPVAGGADKPHTPAESVVQGGGLFVEGDMAWLVYAHDWTQTVDSVIEAVRLKADLSAPAEDPIYLFKGSDAPWLALQKAASRAPRYYPASGPSVYRTSGGGLVALWSSPKDGKPAVAQARSVTGKIRGPWRQQAAALAQDAAFPTVFRRFDGGPMMLVSQEAKPKLVELEDAGGVLGIKHAPTKRGGAR